MRIILLTIILGIWGCGYEEQLAEAEAKEKARLEAEKAEEAEENRASEERSAEVVDENAEDVTRVEVDVDVDVEVEVEQTTAYADESALVIYRPERKCWEDAVAEAPDGFRLLTRAEAVSLYDQGLLDEVSARNTIWTATEFQFINAWTMNTRNGITTAYSRSTLLPAIYIEETE